MDKNPWANQRFPIGPTMESWLVIILASAHILLRGPKVQGQSRVVNMDRLTRVTYLSHGHMVRKILVIDTGPWQGPSINIAAIYIYSLQWAHLPIALLYISITMGSFVNITAVYIFITMGQSINDAMILYMYLSQWAHLPIVLQYIYQLQWAYLLMTLWYIYLFQWTHPPMALWTMNFIATVIVSLRLNNLKLNSHHFSKATFPFFYKCFPHCNLFFSICNVTWFVLHTFVQSVHPHLQLMLKSKDGPFHFMFNNFQLLLPSIIMCLGFQPIHSVN